MYLEKETRVRSKPVPKFPGIWKALGPGFIWLALAQGSGELIWWPYLIAKYGLAFLFLLIPACLIQFPVNYQIGVYTLLTGESIFQGFIRLNRVFAFLLWLLMAVSFLWFGAFASAGGTSLAALTHFPPDWSERGQTLFWAYFSMAVFLSGILFSKTVYPLIEKFMTAVALFTLLGLGIACLHPEVRVHLGSFLKGLVIPSWPEGRTWNPEDVTKLLTAITFAGLGGFWTLFYSYWLKEKGAGMAGYSGHVAGALRQDQNLISDNYFPFEGYERNLNEMRQWKNFLRIDILIGIGGNIVTTLMTCLLAYALLFPTGTAPDKYEIAVVQARFLEISWGTAGRLLFLFAAACFLSDTWLATLDAVSRIHTDFLRRMFPAVQKWSYQESYRFFVFLLTLVTGATILIDEPGSLILISAVLGMVGTVGFSFALLFLNHRVLPRLVPFKSAPGELAFFSLLTAAVLYAGLAAFYFWGILGS